MTSDEWSQAAGLMEQIWPAGGKFRSDQMRSWFELLSELDHEDVVSGIRALALKVKWRPTPSDLRQAVREVDAARSRGAPRPAPDGRERAVPLRAAVYCELIHEILAHGWRRWSAPLEEPYEDSIAAECSRRVAAIERGERAAPAAGDARDVVRVVAGMW